MTSTLPRKRKPPLRAEFNLFDNEVDMDYFAGGGGASMGMEMATGKPVYLAVNHNEDAIEMHKANHPHTIHLHQDVFNVKLDKYLKGKRVGRWWFSPDCRHFSRAKGRKPVSKKIRGLAWVVIKSIKEAKRITGHYPRHIFLENVREFQDWGPLIHVHDAKGRPLYSPIKEPILMPNKDKKGETFKRWVGQLRAMGYEVQWRQLNAADFGAPTHRRRLFLQARCDGKPIRWPTPTHGPGQKKPYRTAAECIDWSIPCPSVFLTAKQATELRKSTGIACKRPLARKTEWRIANGLKRYVIEAAEPFIVQIGYGQGPRINSIHDPLGTAVAGSAKRGIVSPLFTKFYSTGGQWNKADDPLHIITAKDRLALTPAYLVKANHCGAKMRGQKMDEPLATMTGKQGTGVVAPLVTQFNEGGERRSRPADQPMGTLMSEPKFGVVAPILQQVGHRDDKEPGRRADQPVNTLLSKEHVHLTQGQLAPFMAKIGQTGGNGKYSSGSDEPVGTITSKNESLLCAGYVTQFFGGMTGKAATSPLPTVTAIDHNGIVAAFLIKCYGTGVGESLMNAMPTITADGNHLWQVHAVLSQGVSEDAMAGFWRVYAFLCKHLGKDAPLPLVTVGNTLYLIVDIGMRMLVPRELFKAQSFPSSYILTGTQHNQVARCGNSVPPEIVKAIIKAATQN